MASDNECPNDSEGDVEIVWILWAVNNDIDKVLVKMERRFAGALQELGLF